ncbi:MAG: S1 RNA-binding domain-containing protein [Patescibacteria group bacterium]
MNTVTHDKALEFGNNASSIMEELLKLRPKTFLKEGDIINGVVLEKDGARVYLDLGIFGTGIIYGKEYQNARDLLKGLKEGDTVSAKIVDLENEDGLVELSVKEAGAEIAWKDIRELKESGDAIDLRISDSNKGGLVIEFKGIKGFLPASQLNSTHYPRVEGGDKDKISDEFKKLVGQVLSVTILDTDSKSNKLIFTEKGTESEEIKKTIEKYKIGDTVEGEITGVVEFGIFIKIEDNLEGLAHISELDWALVENPSQLFKIGDKIKAKIIAIEGDKISLSVKALKPDPWEINKEKYKKGDIVTGKVLRLNKFGTLVLLDTGIYGLAHISEFGTEKKMRETVESGKLYIFQIAVFQPENCKLSLSFLGKEGEAPRNLKTEIEESKEEKKTEEEQSA